MSSSAVGSCLNPHRYGRVSSTTGESSGWWSQNPNQIAEFWGQPKSLIWSVSLTFFLKDFFLMWAIFKVFIEFVTILLLFYVLVFWPWGTWDLNFLLRDRTHTPCSGRWSLTTRLPGKSPCFPNFRRTVLTMENPQYVLWFLKESSQFSSSLLVNLSHIERWSWTHTQDCQLT